MPPSGGEAAGRGERRKRGGAPPNTIHPHCNEYSQLQAPLHHHHNFYANLVIRRRSQCLERVCECGRLRLQSSPRDPASQTTTPRSCSHHRSSNRSRPTQNARARALLLAPGLRPRRACVQGHHAAARRAQRTNRSPRCRCRCRPPPLPPFLGSSSGSQLAIPACLQQARRHRRQRAALRHRLLSPPRRRKM